ncbi:MAG: CDP-alcohol phosphatidyltransferase family protein [Gammaproteobacteria bacterium]
MTRRDIPNALCILRIALVAPLLWCIVTRQFVLATLLFGFAGFTDILDGYLARRFDWHSSLGALLDPIADKVLTIGVFVSLIVVGLIPRWLAAMVIGRDVVIMLGGLLYRALIGPFEAGARFAGKFNTATMLLFVLLLLARAAVGFPGEQVVMTIGAVLVASTLVSGLDYIREWGGQALAHRRRQKEATEL